jgi:hypothetical protein
MANHKPNQSPDRKGEAQNVEVSADQQDPLAGNSRDIKQATDKATGGMRQQRDAGQRSGNNAVNRGNEDDSRAGNNDEKGRG